MSLLHFLRSKQIIVSNHDNRRRDLEQLNRILSPRRVLLGQILDDKHQLLEGHVVLGFSTDGFFLISYQLQVEGEDVSDTLFSYSLHWWRLELGRPLILVKSNELFVGHNINDSLELLVCQREQEEMATVTVIGYSNVTAGLESSTCYISILSPPSLPHCQDDKQISLHLSYDLLPPFPKFNPSLSFRLPEAVLLNTGCSLVVVNHQLLSASTPMWIIASKSEESRSDSCYMFVQTFLEDAAGHHNNTLSSPCQLLPLEVYQRQEPLVEVAGVSDSIPEDAVQVCQFTFDLEQWLIPTLEEVFTGHSLSLCSLTDYDVQLVEVCELEWIVVFVVVAFTETSSSSGGFNGHLVEIVGQWSVLDNKVEIVTHTDPVLLSLHEIHGTSKSPYRLAYLHAGTLHQMLCSPSNTTIQVLSNYTALSGKSLSSLRHPRLPLSLILTKPERQIL